MSWRHDSNGDGKIDFWDDVFDTFVVTQLVEDHEREDRIRTLTDAIMRSGLTHIENAEFEKLCWENGLRMSDFDQRDIDEIRRRLG